MAIVVSHPIQYQAPWFRALARVVDLDVYFCHRQDAAGQAAAGFDTPFEWDVPLLDGYQHHFLDNRASNPNVFSYSGCDTPALEATLIAGRFDACIVSGWYLKSYVQAMRACRRHRVKLLMRGDSQLGTRRSPIKSAVKWLPYRMFLNRIDAHLYVGQANRAYLRHYGVPDEKLFFVPHFVDNEMFEAGAERARTDGAAQSVRLRFGIPADAFVALFVGRLVPLKRAADLVAAVGQARRMAGADIHVLIVGSGPDMAELQQMAACLRVPAHFAGFCNQTQLPAHYAAADALVLPSDGRETWGLVVNEAMACGLPAIVSDAAGCASDLVQAGMTGHTFPLGDTAALADRLVLLDGDVATRSAEIRGAIRCRLRAYSCEAAVQGTLKAVAAIVVGTGEGHARI